MIAGFLDLLESGDLDADEIKMLALQLKNSTTNTLDMLENLLNWARSQMKGITVKPITIDINTIVKQKVQLFNEIANAKQITIINAVQSDATAYVDANHFGIIVQNLLNNAIKFTPENGFITVDTIPQDRFIEIRVSDTGVGINESNLQKLFTIESHFTTSGTANEKGTGLGLLLCKEFVEKNGGSISVKSKLGEGTTFSFTLPKVQN
jgi:signal transduction histidine kinase